MEKKVILKKVQNLNMGQSLNYIQDTAEHVLNKKRWRQYLIATGKDAQACDGMDGLLINGEYFDWKEFEYRKDDIVMAFLRYFTDDEIGQIALAL